MCPIFPLVLSRLSYISPVCVQVVLYFPLVLSRLSYIFSGCAIFPLVVSRLCYISPGCDIFPPVVSRLSYISPSCPIFPLVVSRLCYISPGCVQVVLYFPWLCPGCAGSPMHTTFPDHVSIFTIINHPPATLLLFTQARLQHCRYNQHQLDRTNTRYSYSNI